MNRGNGMRVSHRPYLHGDLDARCISAFRRDAKLSQKKCLFQKLLIARRDPSSGLRRGVGWDAMPAEADFDGRVLGQDEITTPCEKVTINGLARSPKSHHAGKIAGLDEQANYSSDEFVPEASGEAAIA